MDDYLLGTDVLGSSDDSDDVGATAAGPFVTIHVNDIPGLIKAKGGKAGVFAQSLLPGAVEGVVYGGIRDKIAEGMKAEGVNADVQVVSSVPGAAVGPGFGAGAAIGVVMTGLGYVLFKLIRG